MPFQIGRACLTSNASSWWHVAPGQVWRRPMVSLWEVAERMSMLHLISWCAQRSVMRRFFTALACSGLIIRLPCHHSCLCSVAPPRRLGIAVASARSHSRRCRQSNRNVESALGPTRSPISPALHHAHRGNALEREVSWLRCEVEARATLSLSIAPGRFHRAPVNLNRARMQGSRAMLLIDFGRQLAPSRFCRVLGRLTNL
jgi:hypothetical protein